MEGWQQECLKTWETMTTEAEQFFLEVAKGMSEAADAFFEFSEQAVEELHDALDQLDEQVSEWVEPLFPLLARLDSALVEAAEPVTHTVEPLLNQHPVCVGCRHYHGQDYGGNMLVCAMHPYGVPEGENTCPDKEPISWNALRRSSLDIFNDFNNEL
jgi:hypothetical protein